jgi:hypothetical protein
VFTVRGIRDGRPVAATWEAPDVLEGDAGLIAAAVADVKAGAVVRATPTSTPQAATLTDAFIALILLYQLLDEVVAVTGDVPQNPEAFDPAVIY